MLKVGLPVHRRLKTETNPQIATTDTAHHSPECFGKQRSPSVSTMTHRDAVSLGSCGARNVTLTFTDSPLGVRGMATSRFSGCNPGAMSGTSTRSPLRTTHRATTYSP
jgi:hypothetical protein